MTLPTHRHWLLATGAALLLGAVSSCQPTVGGSAGDTSAPLPPEAQDVSAEWEPVVPGAVELCDSPRSVVTFDKPVERQVFDVITAYKTGLDESMERLTAKVIVEESNRYGLDPWLVVGVIRVESRFYNFAESNRNARGLMQLRPFVAEDLAGDLGIRWTGPDTLYNPIKNVKLGVAYLAILHRRFGGNLERTLAAYNMGPNRVRQWMHAGRELPTGYADLVTDYKGQLREVSLHSEPGADLRSPITAIEHRMARKAALVPPPTVADVDPADDGIATGAAVPGLLANPEPAFDSSADDVPVKPTPTPAAAPSAATSAAPAIAIPVAAPAPDLVPTAAAPAPGPAIATPTPTFEQAIEAGVKTPAEPAIHADAELDRVLSR